MPVGPVMVTTEAGAPITTFSKSPRVTIEDDGAIDWALDGGATYGGFSVQMVWAAPSAAFVQQLRSITVSARTRWWLPCDLVNQQAPDLGWAWVLGWLVPPTSR